MLGSLVAFLRAAYWIHCFCAESQVEGRIFLEKSCNAHFGEQFPTLERFPDQLLAFCVANSFWHMFVVKRREEILRSNSFKEPQLCLINHV